MSAGSSLCRMSSSSVWGTEGSAACVCMATNRVSTNTPSISPNETEQELSTEGQASYSGHLLHSLGIRLVKSNSYNISLFFYIHTTSEGQWILAADVVEHGGQ